MSLRQQLNDSMKEAMKAKDAKRLATLRLVLAALKDRDIAARTESSRDLLGDDEILQLMAKMIKQREESAVAYDAGNRPELAAGEDQRVVAERGTELVEWYIEQQRERARLVWRDYDPSTVPADYQGYYARDQRLAAGPHPGEPTPQQVREQGTSFCVGTPAECIRFLELYESLGIEEVILLCAVGPATHREVIHTIRLLGEQVIPHFAAKQARAAAAN